MKIQSSIAIGLLCSCTIITQKQGPSPCLTLAARCDAETLILCESAVEVSIPDGCTPAADLSALDLSGANFSADDFTGVNFTGAILSAVNFQGAFLGGANFQDANLSAANLLGADLSAAIFEGAILSGADLTFATMIGADTTLVTNCPAALPSDSFRCVNLATAGQNAILGPELSLLNLDVSGIALRDSDLSGADLTGALLSDADLSGSLLINAILANADIDGADLSNADLTGASGAPTGAATAIYSNTTCPDGDNSDDSNNTCVGQGF